jgi:arginase
VSAELTASASDPRQRGEHRLTVIGAPSGAGACGVGQEQAPAALRAAALIKLLVGVGFDGRDLGDSPLVPWHPDRARPRAQNLEAVVEAVRTNATRVADTLVERDGPVLVLGGDCTVGDRNDRRRPGGGG